jgi:hypothetical protein
MLSASGAAARVLARLEIVEPGERANGFTCSVDRRKPSLCAVDFQGRSRVAARGTVAAGDTLTTGVPPGDTAEVRTARALPPSHIAANTRRPRETRTFRPYHRNTAAR